MVAAVKHTTERSRKTRSGLLPLGTTQPPLFFRLDAQRMREGFGDRVTFCRAQRLAVAAPTPQGVIQSDPGHALSRPAYRFARLSLGSLTPPN